MRSNHFLLHFAAFCSFLASICGQDDLPTESTVSTQGSTQIYQPPPTVHFWSGTETCYYFNSLTNVSRTCTTTSSCYSYIRRQADGMFRIKRGCSMDCQDETRRRKIQVCCNTSLCNTDQLSEANFTSLSQPRPQCYQSISNNTCELTTACYSELTYRSDGTHQQRQGCFTGSECVDQSDDRTIRQCCTSHLCNTPISPSTHPLTTVTPTFSSPPRTPPTISNSPPTTSSFIAPNLIPANPDPTSPNSLTCYCSDCLLGACQGLRCGIVITYTHSPLPLLNYTCVYDITMCNEALDPTPSPGNRVVTCCTSDFCNKELTLPTPIRSPTTPTVRQTTVTLHSPQTTTDVTSEDSSTPTENLPSSSDDLFFTFTAVASVLGGLVVVCVILCVLVALIVHIRKIKSSKSIHTTTRSPRQPSPDCHMTDCVKTADSPLASTSSSSASSGEIQLRSELLGTSV